MDSSELPDGAIGAALRAQRQAAGLSLARAAELTGVSKAMLGQIERGESSPTLATLWKIAKGFHLPLTSLLNAQSGFVDGRRGARFAKEVAVTAVFPFDPRLAQESFEVCLTPGQTHQSEAHDVGVWEDVVLLEGSLEMCIEGQWHSVARHRGLRFRGDQPHVYRAGATGAKFLSTMHYPARSA